MSSRHVSSVIFLLAFTALVVALHLPYLKLPFHWDEMGQFVPAALDLYQEGAWIPHSTLPNVHPPGVMAILALVWRVSGYSILSARLAMLGLASLGVFFAFLLAIRLGRGAPGAPAFAAVLFLMAAPIFYMQSMMVLLDMPAMTFTVLALLLFLNGRYGWSAAAATALVLMKETAITTPLALGAVLWLGERRRREAVYFAAPVLALALWLVVLHRATGHWLGNAGFAQYNLAGAMDPFHLIGAIARRAWILFVADGHFLGAAALYAGWRVLRGKEWSLALWVAAAQLLAVTLFGGAMLERYHLPVLPILYAAIATAAGVYPAHWRWASHSAMIALLVAGWFWKPPYPFPLENNLAMVDFVRLQREAAGYLEAYAPDRRIASVWPFTDAIRRPEFGYVSQPLPAVEVRPGLSGADFDILVEHSGTSPMEGGILELNIARAMLRRFFDYRPEPVSREIRERWELLPLERWERGGQWIAIYAPKDFRLPASRAPAPPVQPR